MKKHKHLKQIAITAMLALVTCSWAENNKPVVERTQQELDAMNQSQQGLEVKYHADGSRSVDLKGRFQMTSVAHIVDGKVIYSCQDHEHAELTDPHQHTNQTAIERGVQ